MAAVRGKGLAVYVGVLFLLGVSVPASHTMIEREYELQAYSWDGCSCHCQPYKKLPESIYFTNATWRDCNCPKIVVPKPLPDAEMEAFCQRCECVFRKRMSRTTKVTIIITVSILGLLLLLVVVYLTVVRMRRRRRQFSHSRLIQENESTENKDDDVGR